MSFMAERVTTWAKLLHFHWRWQRSASYCAVKQGTGSWSVRKQRQILMYSQPLVSRLTWQSHHYHFSYWDGHCSVGDMLPAHCGYTLETVRSFFRHDLKCNLWLYLVLHSSFAWKCKFIYLVNMQLELTNEYMVLGQLKAKLYFVHSCCNVVHVTDKHSHWNIHKSPLLQDTTARS